MDGIGNVGTVADAPDEAGSDEAGSDEAGSDEAGSDEAGNGEAGSVAASADTGAGDLDAAETGAVARPEGVDVPVVDAGAGDVDAAEAGTVAAETGTVGESEGVDIRGTDAGAGDVDAAETGAVAGSEGVDVPGADAGAGNVDAPEIGTVDPADSGPVEGADSAAVGEAAADGAGSDDVPKPGADGDAGPAALPELDDPDVLRAALEAILMVVDEPVPEVMLAQVLERPTGTVTAALRALAESYTVERRGFELRQAAGGWRIYTRADFAPYVERFVLDGQQVRLTQAALETLAVVAYKQPVSRGRVSAIRGVNCDGVMRTLVTRGLIEECGAEPDSGAYLYRTTVLFLERMGINSVDELPELAPFLPDDLPEEA
ncbi:SMC-Scp complex subunit ScpB [Actinocatenispora rupis]|uniref:SMC-Scp complex subunit ScpB n=1 Tax=Actinocatenispora rupis TaxID=519421 RepID=UPI0035710C0E